MGKALKQKQQQHATTLDFKEDDPSFFGRSLAQHGDILSEEVTLFTK
jgi:hypothetical protein